MLKIKEKKTKAILWSISFLLGLTTLIFIFSAIEARLTDEMILVLMVKAIEVSPVITLVGAILSIVFVLYSRH